MRHIADIVLSKPSLPDTSLRSTVPLDPLAANMCMPSLIDGDQLPLTPIRHIGSYDGTEATGRMPCATKTEVPAMPITAGSGSPTAPGVSPTPRIADMIADALGPARTVLNVGAGAGSYEPLDREVTAVEPSASMRAQRPAHLSPAVDATAERLPFADDSFDAAMASFTIHQWADLAAGLREVRRVTRGPVGHPHLRSPGRSKPSG